MRRKIVLGIFGTALLGVVIGCGRPPGDGERTTAAEDQLQAFEPAETDPSGEGVSDPAAELARLARDVWQYSAREQLIRIGPPALPYLFAQVAGPDQSLADESIGTIRWIVMWWRDRPEAVPLLAEEIARFALGAAPADRREFAVDLLGDLGDAISVATLAEALEDPSLASTAALALGRIEGMEARQALTDSLNDRSEDHRALVYSILGRRAETESIPLLLEAAERDDDAVAALSGFRDPAVLAWLLEATRRGSDTALAALLSNHAVQQDGSLLAQVASSVTSRADREAALSLVRSPDQYHPDLETALLDMTASGSLGRARTKALLSLSERLDPAVASSVAREALDKYDDAIMTPRALLVCSRFCPPSAAEEVARALESDDSAIRLTAVDALAGMDGEEASNELHRAIQRADLSSAQTMILALATRHDVAAVRAMLDLTETPQDELRETLLQACLVMAPGLSVRRHAALIWARSLDLSVTVPALEGLGGVAGSEQLPWLEEVLGHSSGETHVAARQAVVDLGRRLGRSGDREAAVSALATAFRYGAPVASHLRRLGERVELVAHGGRVDAWWRLTGSPSTSRCTSAEPPSKELARLSAPGQDLAPWRPIEAVGARGIVALSIEDPARPAPQWLVADLVPRGAVPIRLLARSTTSIGCWLNGQSLKPRPHADEDDVVRFDATLSEGGNQLLLRVCSRSPKAALGVRLEDESGRPLKFKIR